MFLGKSARELKVNKHFQKIDNRCGEENTY